MQVACQPAAVAAGSLRVAPVVVPASVAIGCNGLGRMCKPHWNQYTSALRKAALARKAAEGVVPTEVAPTEPEPVEEPEPVRTRAKRGSKAVVPAAGSQSDAG